MLRVDTTRGDRLVDMYVRRSVRRSVRTSMCVRVCVRACNGTYDIDIRCCSRSKKDQLVTMWCESLLPLPRRLALELVQIFFESWDSTLRLFWGAF